MLVLAGEAQVALGLAVVPEGVGRGVPYPAVPKSLAALRWRRPGCGALSLEHRAVRESSPNVLVYRESNVCIRSPTPCLVKIANVTYSR